jgi:hypothetical protein
MNNRYELLLFISLSAVCIVITSICFVTLLNRPDNQVTHHQNRQADQAGYALKSQSVTITHPYESSSDKKKVIISAPTMLLDYHRQRLLFPSSCHACYDNIAIDGYDLCYTISEHNLTSNTEMNILHPHYQHKAQAIHFNFKEQTYHFDHGVQTVITLPELQQQHLNE